MAKADHITPQSLVWLDEFLLDFSRNPITGLLAGQVNEAQAKSMLKTLILTRQGSVPHEEMQGSQVGKLEFELMDYVTRDLLETTITEAIVNHLPFINLLGLKIDERGQAVEVTIVFMLSNSTSPVEVTVPLKRTH